MEVIFPKLFRLCSTNICVTVNFLYFHISINNMVVESSSVTVGVLALQGAFNEHIQLLRQAAQKLNSKQHDHRSWQFLEVRTEKELNTCDALIIPGGESTAISLVAQRSNMLDPLRDFVK